MKGKRTIYCEIAYVVGIVVLALGTALMEKADFGMSMVVAPAYLIHLKASEFFPFFSFGMSEYVFQAFLLGVLSLIMGRAKKSYLFSFGTAFLYGIVLDAVMGAVAWLPWEGILWQAICYVAGMLICAVGVAFLFHTYFPPEAYELFVKELSQKCNMTIAKTKTIYDCCSCLFGVVLSLCFFGRFVGVQWGTVVCAAVNGWLIGKINHFLENTFVFQDAFPFREKLN